MADNISFTQGQAHFVAGEREPAWHRWGKLREGLLTPAEAMQDAMLADWNVRLVPVYAGFSPDSKTGRLLVPNKFATIYTNPVSGNVEAIGIVGKVYKVFQNEQIFDFANYVLGEGPDGMTVSAAGALGNPISKVFMTLRFPEAVMIAGEDAHDLYLVLWTAHDGSSSLHVNATHVRAVCQNTVQWGESVAKTRWTIRHSGDLAGKVQQAREKLELTFKADEAFQAEAEAMLKEKFSNKDMDRFVKVLIPDTESEHQGWRDRIMGQRSTIMDLFKNADTQEFGRGTKYAAYNSVVEFADWLRPGSAEQKAKEASGFELSKVKEHAYALLTA